jgi:diguanylate cyclase (GGDEF)-like protein
VEVLDGPDEHAEVVAPTFLPSVLDRTRPATRVLTYAALLAALGATLLALTPFATALPHSRWTLSFFALAIGFGVCEATALHVEIRKESRSLSLSAIPLMFGLLYSSPALLAVAYVVGTVPVLRWVRGSHWVKVIWNACLFMCQAALAAWIVRSALGLEHPRNTLEWMVPLGAILIVEVLSIVAVPLVIMLDDGKLRPRLFADFGRSQILACLAGTFTVTTVAASLTSPWMALYALVPLLGVSALLQNTGRISQRFHDLQQLHTFTRAITNETGPRTLDMALVELTKIMRSKSAGLLVKGSDGNPSILRIIIDDAFHDLGPEPIGALFLDVLDSGEVTLLTVDDPNGSARKVLHELEASTVLAVRVLGEAGEMGVLFVGDRLGMRSDFNVDEFRLFASLANTLSARLSNDHLVERLETQARSDALTGLANRMSFEIALTSELVSAEKSGVVVMVDLDRFKEINDSLGHETGDRLLIEIADRLRSVARRTDMVARFGGDEFAMLLGRVDPDDPAEMTRRIDDVHRRLTAKVELEGLTFEVGASMGVVQWPEQGGDSAGLLRRADTAMYEAKRNQLGVVWYSSELDANAPRRLDLYMSVSSALESEEFCVHFQPKVALRDGRITGVEALIRWTHPLHGSISPVEFVPLIVQAGLIGKLTRLVMRRAAEASVAMRAAGLQLPVAVNLTPRDLLDRALVEDMTTMLAETGVAPSDLQVELTEDAMIVDFDTSVVMLRELRDLGLRISIDDFGTGYSSLQHLHRLPVDELKIDRNFVGRVTTDTSAAAIVRASINLAADLGLTTVAEGVEDEETLNAVMDLGCDEVQGYLVCRPMSLPELIGWARNWRPGQLGKLLSGAGPARAAGTLFVMN